MPPPRHTRRPWLEPQPIELPPALLDIVGGNRLLADRLARQNITSAEAAQRFLDPAAYHPAPASDLPDIDRAVARLSRAIRQRERILVWGDFDVDGQTATAALYQALESRGADVHYRLPNRFSEGHGIHLPTLKRHLDAGIDLVLTCDTGVDAHEAVAYAASRGVDSIITDHHALPAKLPPAIAVVNPRRLPERHALRELPGVGVAYKLIEALCGEDGAESALDLVALGIVSDVMIQVDDTRYLLQRGLKKLRENRRVGLRAILERAEINPADLNEGHIGFAIAPRLNALGRLDDASPAVELLTTRDWAKARGLAHRLESYNARRRFLTDQVYQSALAQIEAEPALLEYAALVLSHSDWHSGVIGIVASRLVEEFARPTVLISTDDGFGRGSARSLPGLDINAAFGQAARHLQRYGGHSMAAGMSLDADKIFDFRRDLSRALRDMGADERAAPALQIDGCLSLGEITLGLTREIALLAPFGNGNPPLALVARDLKLRSHKGLGRRGEHLRLEVEDDSGESRRVIWWRGAGRDLPTGRFDLAFTLRESEFGGEKTALIEWLDFRQREESPTDLSQQPPSRLIVDHRRSPSPETDLARALEDTPAALLWAEVHGVENAVDRLHLQPAETLIVWTIPPSAEIWQAALATVNPARLIVFSQDPQLESRAAFLKRLAALVKFAINRRNGHARLEELAAATAERERTVWAGLKALQALGKLKFARDAGGNLRLRLSNALPSPDLPRRERRLDLLLRESRAYRDYWRSMPLRRPRDVP